MRRFLHHRAHWWRGGLAALILPMSILLVGCSLSPKQLDQVDGLVAMQRDHTLDCPPSSPDRCAEPTPLSTLTDGEHPVLIPLEHGTDALATRIHLLRAARSSIEIQNYIFYNDDSGRVLLDEMIAAARRGVAVRLLVDGLFSLPELDALQRLVTAHRHLEVRLYNPLLNRATPSVVQALTGVVCCFHQLNHRMHLKSMIVDDRYALLGGRNGADRYFDLDTRMVFRDFEALVIGHQAQQVRESFDQYWQHHRSIPAWHTRDVYAALIGRASAHTDNRYANYAPQARQDSGQRALRIAALASDAQWQQARLVSRAIPVERVEYFWDPVDRPYRLREPSPATRRIFRVIAGAAESVYLQSPYFVISRDFREVIEALPKTVAFKVSTNSLASTDAFPVYAIQRRERQMALSRLGLEIFEMKPYPADRHNYIPRYAQLIAEKADGLTSPARGDPAPATRESVGPRVSLHAKLVVVDGARSVVTSHNFDPRSERYNTENGIVVHGREFAQYLIAEIQRDLAPQNAWYVGLRDTAHPVSRVGRVIAGWSRRLPTLDLWPARYTRNYQLPTGQTFVPWWDEDFHAVWEPVGEFPEIVHRPRIWSADFIGRMLGFLKPLM